MRKIALVAALFTAWLFAACEQPQESTDETTQKPTEQPQTPSEPAADEPTAEGRAPAEQPAAEEPTEEAPAKAEPAPTEEPAGEAGMEEGGETIVVPPTVSDSSEPHKGEPPSASQPQPVYPDGEPGDAAGSKDTMETEEPAGEAVMEGEEETIVVPPTVSEDASSEPHKGEPPSASQPQPVYPDGEPADAAGSKDTMETEEPAVRR